QAAEKLDTGQMLVLCRAGIASISQAALSTIADRLEKGLMPSWKACSVVDVPQKAGDLLKLSRWRNNWNKRYFVLTEQFLYRYGKDRGGEPKEKVLLGGCSARLAQVQRSGTMLGSTNDLNAISLILPSGEECLTLSSQDDREVCAWHTALNCAIEAFSSPPDAFSETSVESAGGSDSESATSASTKASAATRPTMAGFQSLSIALAKGRSKGAPPIYTNMKSLAFATWDDLQVSEFVPFLAELCQQRSDEMVTELAGRLIALLSVYTEDKHRPYIATLDVVAVCILLLKEPCTRSRLYAAITLANVSEHEGPSKAQLTKAMVELGLVASFVALLKLSGEGLSRQDTGVQLLCVCSTLYNAVSSGCVDAQALLKQDLVRALIEAQANVEEGASSTTTRIARKLLQLFRLFKGAADTRLELANQEGLVYVMSLAEEPHCAEVRASANMVLVELYGVDDGMVTYLPLRKVILLARSKASAVKLQAAKGLASCSMRLASELAGDSGTADVLPMVTATVALLSEALAAVAGSKPIDVQLAEDRSLISLSDYGRSSTLISPSEYSPEAIPPEHGDAARVPPGHAPHIISEACRTLHLLCQVPRYRPHISEHALQVLLQVLELQGSTATEPKILAATTLAACIADGDHRASSERHLLPSAMLEPGAAAIVLAAARSGLMTSEPKFSEVISTVLAAMCSSKACQQQLDAHHAGGVLLSHMKDVRPPHRLPDSAQVNIITATEELLKDAGIRSRVVLPVKKRLWNSAFRHFLAAPPRTGPPPWPPAVQEAALRCLKEALEEAGFREELAGSRDALRILGALLDACVYNHALLQLAVEVRAVSTRTRLATLSCGGEPEPGTNLGQHAQPVTIQPHNHTYARHAQG
ncbi:hypothetical protein CYMTET_49772, partial [Cymbomonas tetramitiformis]